MTPHRTSEDKLKATGQSGARESGIPGMPETGNEGKAAELEHGVPPNQDGQPDSVKQSGQAGRDAHPVNQNLPPAQGSRQPDRGGKK